MVEGFLPAHPFLDGKSELSNAAFAAYLLVWTMTSSPYPQAARQKLAARPGFGSGLLFDLYMQWLTEDKAGDRRLDLADVGALYASFALQAGPRQQASLEVTGEAGDDAVEVSFDMETPGGEDHEQRHLGPYKAALDGILEFRGTLGNVTISAPVDVIVGDGSAVCFSAPVDIDVNTLEINARDVSVVRPAVSAADAVHQVALTAAEADVRHVARVVVLGGRLSVTFPGARIHPWTDHHVEPPPAPSPEIEVLRRRLRRVLTAFRSHSKGAYVRLAAKIDHERMMKRDDLGPRLIERLLQDKILTTFDAGKFYVLHQDTMAFFLNMDYQALHQHKWTPKSDQYLASVAR